MDAFRFSRVTAVTATALTVFFLLAVDVKTSSADKVDDLIQDVSFNIGPSPKNLNLVGASKDILLDGNTSVYGTVGFSNMYIGGGVAYYSNGNRNDGLVYSAALGLLPDITAHATAAYQLKIERKHYAVAGVGIHTVAGDTVGATLVLAYEYKY